LKKKKKKESKARMKGKRGRSVAAFFVLDLNGNTNCDSETAKAANFLLSRFSYRFQHIYLCNAMAEIVPSAAEIVTQESSMEWFCTQLKANG
jgi:hypothetical protein